jgi:hypothetical protein
MKLRLQVQSPDFVSQIPNPEQLLGHYLISSEQSNPVQLTKHEQVPLV